MFHCVWPKQVGLRREDAKLMENFRSACLRIISEICTFVKCIVCMFSGLNTPKLQTPGRHARVGPLWLIKHTFWDSIDKFFTSRARTVISIKYRPVCPTPSGSHPLSEHILHTNIFPYPDIRDWLTTFRKKERRKKNEKKKESVLWFFTIGDVSLQRKIKNGIKLSTRTANIFAHNNA